MEVRREARALWAIIEWVERDRAAYSAVKFAGGRCGLVSEDETSW